MDEDINDAQKILPSSVPRVNTPSSVSAWHRVQISGREGITPSPGSYHGRRDAPPSFLTRLIDLKAKDAGNGWGSTSRCAEICSLFFFKERNLDSFNPLHLPASFFFFFLRRPDFNLPCGVSSEPNKFPLSRLTLVRPRQLQRCCPPSSGKQIILLLGVVALKQSGRNSSS